MKKIHIPGTTFLITGGAMGMGKLYAQKAVTHHAQHVIVWDVDQQALDNTVAELQALASGSTRVHGIAVDVRDRNSVDQAIICSLELGGSPDVLINNAGVVRTGSFWTNDQIKDIDFILDINTSAVIYLTRALLPHMMDTTNRPRRIVNIASAAGLIPQPDMAVYAASKWAIIGWSESLRLELQASPYKNIAVTTICPSFINSEMFAGAKPPTFTSLLDPYELANIVWKAIINGTPIVIRPPFVYVARYIMGGLPVKLRDIIAKKLGAYTTLEEFIGRK